MIELTSEQINQLRGLRLWHFGAIEHCREQLTAYQQRGITQFITRAQQDAAFHEQAVLALNPLFDETVAEDLRALREINHVEQ